MQHADLVILGGGTGGYVAAIRAGQLGMKVVVVERDKVGGTCLHRGCIPTKAFLRSAEVFHTLRHASDFGLCAGEVKADWVQILRHKEQVVGQLWKGVQGLLRKSGVSVLAGTGVLSVPPAGKGTAVTVTLAGGGREELTAPHVILATGSRPRTLGIPIDGSRVITSDEAIGLESLPRRAVVLGGGAIGAEWASLFADLGVEVTLLEMMDRILPLEDPDISQEAERSLRRRGIQIIAGAAVDPSSVVPGDGPVRLTYSRRGESASVEADLILVSVGRAPNSEGIGLEHYPGVKVERGRVLVDEFGRTGQPGIFAIGDLVGGALAHVAAHQGIVAVEWMADKDPYPIDLTKVPHCTYTRPEVASVGLTEAQAEASGRQVRVGRFPFRAIGKALVYGEPEGFVKLVADARTSEVVGVHVIGPHATDLIGEAALASFVGATAWELGAMIHPHPTLSEIFGEAGLALQGHAIHS